MTTPRKFLLSGAILLVAATAVGVALFLAYRLLGFATLWVRVHGESYLAIWFVRLRSSQYVRMRWPWHNLLFDIDHLNTMGMMGLAVAYGWMLLLESGRWRPERS
jgi:hypothetical protein